MSRLAHNARLMVKAGQMISQRSQGEVRLQANELVSRAMRFQSEIFVAKANLVRSFLFPQGSRTAATAVGSYQSLLERFDHTCNLQQTA